MHFRWNCSLFIHKLIWWCTKLSSFILVALSAFPACRCRGWKKRGNRHGRETTRDSNIGGLPTKGDIDNFKRCNTKAKSASTESHSPLIIASVRCLWKEKFCQSKTFKTLVKVQNQFQRGVFILICKNSKIYAAKIVWILFHFIFWFYFFNLQFQNTRKKLRM